MFLFQRLFEVLFGTVTLAAQPVVTLPPAPAPVLAIGLTDAEIVAEATAQAEKDTKGNETIEIISDAPASSASSVKLDRDALRFRSRTQPSDILRQVPGLVVSQHAGGGKSDQYFIRGFDADHGTDVAIFADGIPVNLTSHGHGQGYADTHWMIPETVQSVEMHKGPYAARFGDFYTAGALELKTIDNVGDSTVWVAAGAPLGASSQRAQRYDRRLVGMASPNFRGNKDDKSLLALQVAEADGPFANPQDFQQGNALGKWDGKVGPGRLKLQGTWYQGSWNQSGQLPANEIDAGRLDRFGAIDPTEGGNASRSSGQLSYGMRDDDGTAWKVMGYGVKNNLQLYSNFTLFARDTEHGDQIEQTDDRWLYGADASYERWIKTGNIQALWTAGVQLRNDVGATSLWHAQERTRLPGCFGEQANPCNHTFNNIRNLAAYTEANIAIGDRLQVLPGLRADGFAWSVEDRNPMTTNDPMTTTAGEATAGIISPKLSVLYHADPQVTLFANAGSGFHTNDARAAVASNGKGAIARATGGETGVRMKPHPKARISADVWYLKLASEQVWSGDAGGTEASDPTRRFGLDMEGSVEATSWLGLDANVTWAKSKFVANAGNGGALALAPRWMGSGGITAHDQRGFVAVRARGIGDRAGNDTGELTAEGYFIVDVMAGTQLGKVDLNLTVNNALDANGREAQFAEESRVSPTAPLVEQMHYT
ncbi:MAG: TonB-dependent receptor, partial [Deltaproteobacteria bacterium]|nr:TonB-dependent receptor [Deltaproteobacteria bacterium]